MKSYLRGASAIFAFMVVSLCASAASAQMVGGFKAIASDDQVVVAAAEFAAEAQAAKVNGRVELISVAKAERQVVQGSIYRLCLNVYTSGAEDEADIKTVATATVFRDLKGKFVLRAWTEEDCRRPRRPRT